MNHQSFLKISKSIQKVLTYSVSLSYGNLLRQLFLNYLIYGTSLQCYHKNGNNEHRYIVTIKMVYEHPYIVTIKWVTRNNLTLVP